MLWTILFLSGGVGPVLKENPALLGYFHTWEIYNGSTPLFFWTRANQKSRKFYEEIVKDFDIGVFAGDDSHTYRGMALNTTTIERVDCSSSDRLNKSLRDSLKKVKDLGKLKTQKLLVDAGGHTSYHIWDRLKGKIFPKSWFADPGEYKKAK